VLSAAQRLLRKKPRSSLFAAMLRSFVGIQRFLRMRKTLKFK
jgi:hypothetical protein